MATKNLIPRSDGEGGIGIPTQAWGDAYFKSGHFLTDLTLEGNPVLTGFTEINDLSTAVTWSDVPDVNITQSSVTQHQGALNLTSNQISDLGTQGFLTSFTELNDLSTAVTWADVPDINITESSVIQHQGALSLTSSQISNFQTTAESLSGNYKIDSAQLTFNSTILPESDATYDIGSATNKVRDIYLSPSSLHLGSAQLSSDSNNVVSFPSGINLGNVSIDTDDDGRVLLGTDGMKIGAVELKPDPDNPQSLFFNEIPQVKDAEGNAVTVLTADKLGLGTAAVLTGVDQDITFKLLTDQQRFVVGTTGDYGLESGWYRFNDFKVKGATDIGAHPINPVDTRIYSDESSFILFTTDTAGNRVAHLVGGEEEVNANNAIALGIAVKVDDGDSPSDIEFVHTDGESYSVINGDSDSLGTNGLPIRQGFQNPSIGSNPSPLLIDGGYF